MSRKSIRKPNLMVIYYLTITLFSTFVLLWALVIPHGGVYIETPVNTSNDQTSSSEDQISTSTLSYPGEVASVLESGTIIGTYATDSELITIYKIRLYNSNVFVADVVVSDASSILSGLAYNNFGGMNYVQTVSAMAEEYNAIFAINADFASHYSTGYVIKNGQILRSSTSSRSDIVLYEDGTVSSFAESSTSVESVLADGAWQLWSFGPVLINDGTSVASVNDGIDRDRVNNPRTAFGMVDALHYMFVVVDGRTTISSGVDIEELASIMQQLGCTEAYNLDGGGSSTMWFDGEVINVPSQGSEREVSDCVYLLG